VVGTTVNAAAIIIGASVGLLFKKGIPDRVRLTITHGVGLAVLLIGLQMSMQTQQILVVVISLVLGGLTGELLNIEGGLNRLGKWLELKIGSGTGEVGRAFVTASLIYCIGAMAVMGSIEDGLNNNPRILFTKAALDGISSVVLTSTMGIGVAFSAIPVFVYQGAITLLAGLVKGVLSPAVMAEMTATGGLLIIGIALNIMNIIEIKVGNLLPSIFFAVPIAIIIYRIIPA